MAEDGLREADPDMVGRLYEKDTAVAEDMVSRGQQLGAAQRLRDVARTFDGLHPVDEALARAEELEASAEARKQRKAAKRWQAFEHQSTERLAQQIVALRSSNLAPPASQVVRELRIDELLRRAGRAGAEGEAAQRVLNTYSSQFSFYMARDFLAAEHFDRAAVALEVAVRIRTDNAAAWYNLACARARLRRSSSAVEALERAVEHGFGRCDLLDTDSDLDALRDREDFKTLLAACAPG